MPTAGASHWRRLDRIAVGLLAALLVYALYYPADSVAVELGQAVYFCGGALVFGWVAWTARPTISSWQAERWSLLLDASVWGLAAWMAVACWANASQINLRMAVNEMWLWVAAAAIVTGVRRTVLSPVTRNAIVFLTIAAGTCLAVHAWHQLEVSLPADRARYEADPDSVLREVGISPSDAPPGSAQRMNFVNRLYDGGPTATFALANSLAAFLLLSWVLAFGVLLRQGLAIVWKARSATGWGFLAISVASVVILGFILLRSNSRSAVGSAVLAAGGLLAYELGRGRFDGRWKSFTQRAAWKKKIAAAMVGIFLLVVGGAFWVASRGELVERALPSVLFRFQYWRSTLALAFDSPWFGCGPGNFQANYERYRDLAASEQIADPHNWLMETLAAGGFPAVVFLGLAIASLFRLSCREGRQAADVASPDIDRSAAVWAGAGLGLFAVWVMGALIGWIPDFDAQLYALPTAGLVLVGLWRCRSGELELRGAVVVALLAVMLHLSFSGGWTVPGVAFPIWILAASLVPVSAGSKRDMARVASPLDRGISLHRLAALLVGGILLLLIQKTAITPSQRLTIETRHASEALARDRMDQAKLALQRAAESDPWNPHPVRELAGLQEMQLLNVNGDDLPTTESESEAVARMFKALDRMEQEALSRSPGDPALWRYFGRQRLHLYQRWGRSEDLAIALQRLERGFQLAPAQEGIAAQIALIEQRRGRVEDAEAWARRAQRLAKAGGHIERGLDRVVVLAPEKIGQPVHQQPLQSIASEALANLLGS